MNKSIQSRVNFSTLLIFLTAALMFLLSACSTLPSSAGASPTSSSNTPGPAVTTTSTAQSTPQLTQQYEFTAQDSGKTATYTVTSRFTLILNALVYPKANLKLTCHPEATIGTITNLPAETPPLYAVRYEAEEPGSCTIKNGAFLLTVNIIGLD